MSEPQTDYEITQNMAEQTLTNLRAMKERYQQDALRDGLTGLYNRRALDQDLKAMVGWDGYSIVFLDVDNFKKFNDTFGHDVADDVLKDIGRAAQASSRGEEDKVYRYGGEEIAVFYRGKLSEDKLVEKAEALRQRVQQIKVRSIGEAVVTVSIGLATKADNDNPKDVLIRAETAMRIAKGLGKNQYSFGKKY